ncbi:CoA ester lyase [Myxococcaceae bacterium JPH2]|nr:CoA ester lyase [Myxococcaceae bacterium JPH2]
MFLPNPCRTFLVTPALDASRFDKALDVGADVGLLDLEDGVPPALKAQARQLAVEHLCRTGARLPLAVRINSLRTADGLRDVLALLESGARPRVIMLPKVEAPAEVQQLDELLAARMPDVALMAIIETPRGVEAVDAIVTACERLRGIIFGAADLSAQLGVPLTWEPMFYARSRIAMAAALGGRCAIDSPFFDLGDPQGLAAEMLRAHALGFTGKIAIHPQQVAIIHESLKPSARVVDHARRVLAQADDGQGGIHVVGGNMVGPPLVAAARRVLASVQPDDDEAPVPLRIGSRAGES